MVNALKTKAGKWTVSDEDTQGRVGEGCPKRVRLENELSVSISGGIWRKSKLV